MYIFKVNGDSYKVRFGYGALYKTNLIDRVIKATSGSTKGEAAESIKNLIGLTAELLLEGMQKYHKDKFGYDTDEERDARIREVCDLLDDYEDEHAEDDVADGETALSGFTVFNDLNQELMKNGFLSRVTRAAAETAASQNATVLPMEHQRKKKVGAKQ